MKRKAGRLFSIMVSHVSKVAGDQNGWTSFLYFIFK